MTFSRQEGNLYLNNKTIGSLDVNNIIYGFRNNMPTNSLGNSEGGVISIPSASTSFTPSTNRTYAKICVFTRPTYVQTISINCTTLRAGDNASLVIYLPQSQNGVGSSVYNLSTLLKYYGQISIASTGVKTWTVNTLLPAGLVYICFGTGTNGGAVFTGHTNSPGLASLFIGNVANSLIVAEKGDLYLDFSTITNYPETAAWAGNQQAAADGTFAMVLT